MMNLNINKLETSDYGEKRKIEEMLNQLMKGDYCLKPQQIIIEMGQNPAAVEDYLAFIEGFLSLTWHVVDLGYTDHALNHRLLTLLQELLESLLERQVTMSWYSKVVDYAVSRRTHQIALRKVTNKCLDLLLLLTKVRANLQVLAYLKHFKESHDDYKKFRCQISFLQELFDIYNFNKRENSYSGNRRQGVFGGIFTTDDKNKRKPRSSHNHDQEIRKKSKKFSQVSPNARDGILGGAKGLEDQLTILKGYEYPFMDILVQVYYSIASTPLGCETSHLTEYVKVNNEIQSKIFKLFNSYYLQKELFVDHVHRVLLFVGVEELMILRDFDGESKGSGQQVVSVNKLKEKITQILLDDITIQNQLQNISNNDNKHRRILEFTNIINKILGKFAERLFKPRLFQKTQDLLRILNFHEILMDIFKVRYDESRHDMMMMKTLRLFEYYIFDNVENMATLLPHCQIFIDLVEHKLQPSRVLSCIFQNIQSTWVKQKIIKTVFDKVYRIAEKPDVFLLPRMKPGRYEYDPRESARDKLVEYFKVLRNLMVDGKETNKKNQQLFVENLIFCFSLSKNLLPSQLDLLVTPEARAELQEGFTKKDSLLELLVEFFSLINLAILNNNNSMLIIVSLLDQVSLKTIIMNDNFHPLLKVQLVRLYTEAYVFSMVKSNPRRFDKDKVTSKVVDVLGYINDHMLIKFQSSLPFLLEYGLLPEATNREFFDLLDDLVTKHKPFHFDYQNERNPSNRKKAQQFYEVADGLNPETTIIRQRVLAYDGPW